MKKITMILTALMMVWTLTGCNQDSGESGAENSGQSSSQSSVSSSEPSDSSSASGSSSSEQQVDDYQQQGEHTVGTLQWYRSGG